MKLIFPVPPEADGALLRNFLRRCAVSTELARAVKFHGSGFWAGGQPILANRRVEAGQDIWFELPADGAGVAPQPEIPVQAVYEDAFAIVLDKPPPIVPKDCPSALTHMIAPVLTGVEPLRSTTTTIAFSSKRMTTILMLYRLILIKKEKCRIL